MREMRAATSVLFIIISLFITNTAAGIYQVTQELDRGGLLSINEGVFSPDDAPLSASPGDGRAFVSVQASVTIKDPHVQGDVQVVIFHSENLPNVRRQAEDKYAFCCVDENSPYCTPGEVQLNADTSEELEVFTFEFGNGTTAELDETVSVKKSGVWYFYVVNCKADDNDAIFEGKVTFMNPYGYLPAQLYPFLPFYGVLALVYIVMGLIWLIVCLRFRAVILPLQIWIGVVIGLAIVESATLYFDDLGYNNSGENYVAAMIVGVLVSTLKRTVSRVLVLVVSLGYGVVRPTLGGTKWYVLLLAFLYLLFSGALNVVDLVQKSATQSSLLIFIFLLLPVAFLDTAFYWWIFMSLLRTTHQLGVRKQTVKMQMYTYFLRTLVCFGVATAIFMLIQVIVTSKESTSSWKVFWLWTAGWQVLYFLVLVAIALLWRPTVNNTRYAYTETGGDPDDEVVLHTFGDVSTRSTPLDIHISNEITLDPNASFTIDEDDIGVPGQGKME